MPEIIYVFTGWLLSLLTVYVRDFIVTHNKTKALLIQLVSDFDSNLKAALDSIAFHSEAPTTNYNMPYIPRLNSWWESNKLLYLEHLPIEALIFDKWNSITEDLDGLNDGKFDIKAYAALAKETKNSLKKSLANWQKPWYTCLFLRLVGKI